MCKSFLGALCALVLSVGGASAATYTADNIGLIVDSSARSYTFDVTDTGSITGIEIAVGFSTCGASFTSATGPCTSNSSFPFTNELGLTLTSAAGSVVNLITPGTYNGNGVGSFLVHFADDALAALGVTPASGSFRPVGSLSDLIGENPLGQWALTIRDTVGADPKRLDSFALTLTTDVAPVPLPAALPMLLVGLGGLVAVRRRRRA